MTICPWEQKQPHFLCAQAHFPLSPMFSSRRPVPRFRTFAHGGSAIAFQLRKGYL